MVNLELAHIFYQIAEFLEMKGVEFKPRAYEKVARVLESLEEDVREIYQKGGLKALEEIPGVGESIALKIEEYLKTGRIKDYEKLKKECPVKLEELTAIEGLGPKMIKVLYQKLGIRNIADLERAARQGRIRHLFGFGPKTEENILQGIEFLKRTQGRFLLNRALFMARTIKERLAQLKEVEKIEIAGSLRRRKETIGDIDLLVVSGKPDQVMDFFVKMPEVEKIWAKGPTKSSVRLKEGLDCDLRVIQKQSFGSALQYFTGNKDHNIVLRRIAQERGFKLNEYGLFRGRKKIAGQTEEEIYQKLGLTYIQPELRENQGEIEAALKNKLPQIIGYEDIKGDLHTHTNWSDGAESIEKMARAAQKMNYQYLAITDHTGTLKIAHGLDEKKLLSQMREIDRINKKFGSHFRILKGAEVNIKVDGSLDIKDEILAKLDIVVASVHSNFKMSRRDMTERIVRAMKNPYVKIIGHPTGRVLFQREGYSLDLEKIFQTAKETNTALEINSYPERLDLNDLNIKKAVEMGVKLVIDTDAHSQSQLNYIELGVAQARRGWAESKDILNTLNWQKLKSQLKRRD